MPAFLHHLGLGNINSKITTSASKKNFEVADGDATMRVWKSGDVFTTNSTLTTMNRMSFRYGYLEIYAKVPTTSGAFPSFWLQSAEQHRADKRVMTEVDVFEIYTKNKMESDGHTGRKRDPTANRQPPPRCGTFRGRRSGYAASWH